MDLTNQVKGSEANLFQARKFGVYEFVHTPNDIPIPVEIIEPLKPLGDVNNNILIIPLSKMYTDSSLKSKILGFLELADVFNAKGEIMRNWMYGMFSIGFGDQHYIYVEPVIRECCEYQSKIKRFYVIMVKHIPTGEIYVSGEGYNTAEEAINFLINERCCDMYDNFDKKQKDGWYGFPVDDNEHVYYIREIEIKD